MGMAEAIINGLSPFTDLLQQAGAVGGGEPGDMPAWAGIVMGVSSLIIVLVIVLVPVVAVWGPSILDERGHRRELRQEEERLWDLHVRDLNKLKAEYTAFETDPWTAFHRPLLSDVTEPLTAEFHRTFARAQKMHTEQQPTNRGLVDLFGNAVREANAAWMAADQHARAVAVPTKASATLVAEPETQTRLALTRE